MQNEGHPLSRYNVKSDDERPNTFLFETAHAASYEVRFKPSGYLFPDEPSLEPHVYELIIALLDNPSGQSPPNDPLLPPTIAYVLSQFLAQNERVIVYICDSSDGRGAARQRKFYGWFEAYKGVLFSKMDNKLLDHSGAYYYTSLIVRNDNPQLATIFLAFHRLIAGYNEEK